MYLGKQPNIDTTPICIIGMDRLNISCHHGDIKKQNNLTRAKQLMKKYPEIDIFEIDFISYEGKVISSHDYNETAIKNGSSLEKWVKYVVVDHRKVLWLDIKENLDIYFCLAYGKFDHLALFDRLEKLKTRYGHEVDITSYIWIGCQEKSLRRAICKKNKTVGECWQIIFDMPTVSSYIWHKITPECMLPYLMESVCDEFHQSDYVKYNIISIDQSFFPTRKDIKDFIKSLIVDNHTIIVINSFDRSVKPIQVDDYYIVMQYDYSNE